MYFYIPHSCIDFNLCVAAKNSQELHQNNSTDGSKDSVDSSLKINESSVKNAVENCSVPTCYSKYSPVLPIEVFKTKMWQKTRTCLNFVGVLLNNATARGIKTLAASNAARSSPAQPGYVSEDKILQIKPHSNDYAVQYPSVTLVLNKTMPDESKAAIEKWKQGRIAELGEEEFNRVYEGTKSLIGLPESHGV